MKVGLRYARLSAAILAALYGASAARADNLIWDPAGTAAPGGSEGSGNWDTSTVNWADQTTSNNVAWSNVVPPNSAIFGTGTASTGAVAGVAPINVFLTTNISAQDITLNAASTGTYYNILDDGNNEVLTLAGNIIKASPIGTSAFGLSGGISLTAGNHVVAINDTSGPVPELSMNTVISGAGQLTLDNSNGGTTAYTQYGTLVLNEDNTYTGGTNIVDGALTVNSQGALGSGVANISNAGALEFGGNGTVNPAGTFNVSTPITISRNTYTGTNFGDYTDAIISTNPGNAGSTVNFTGPFVVDSTDARVAANTSNIVISSSLSAGPDIAAGTGVLDLDGDYSGFITLSGNNTAYGAAGNAIQLINGVELHVSSEANLGGATSKLNLSGGTIDPSGSLLTSGFMTNFGMHNLAGAAINTGIDTETSNTFTVNGLSGVAIGERGTGTMNFNGTNTFTGTPFFDGGTVNVNGSTTVAGFDTRSPVFNIAGGATVTTTTAANATVIIADSNSYGNPDHGTLNIASGATLADGGGLVLSDDIKTAGTINNAGTLTVNNETWIGNDNVIPTTSTNPGDATSTATFNQTAGSTTVNSWFVVGRNFGTPQTGGANGGQGTATFSGGTFTKNGGGNTSIGENANATGTVTINGNTAFTISSGGGDFYIGHNGGTGNVTLGSATAASTATLTTNGQFDIGYQNGATGTLTQYAGTTITSNNGGGNAFDIGDGTNGPSTGTFNMYGGTDTVQGETWIGSNSGTSAGTFNMTAGSYTGNSWFVVGRNGSLGTLNISGGSITRGGTATGNQNYVGEAGQTGSTMNVSGTGSVTFNTGQFWLGNGGTSAGTLNISQNGSVQVTNNWLAVSRNTSGGTASVINISGGTLTKTGSYVLGTTSSNGTGTSFTIGSGGGSIGIVNQTGGAVSSAGTFIGENGTGTYNISAGTATFTNALSVGTSNSGNGTFDISGTGSVNAQTLTVAAFDASTGVVNLNGGTLAVAGVVGGTTTGSSTFNFNGGTLEPTAATTAFVSGLTTANVQSGGAVINTGGYAETIGQPLVHAASLGTTIDGGLALSGTGGTLTLSGVNTYTGPTAVTGTAALAVASTGSIATTTLNSTTAITNNGTIGESAGGLIDSIVGTGALNLTGGTLALTDTKLGTISSEGSIAFSGGAKLNIETGQVQVSGNQYTPLAGDYTAGTLYSSNAQANPVTRVVGINYNSSTNVTTARYTTYGDVNLDGKFNGSDVAAINSANNFGGPVGSATWATGDENYDGKFNGKDVALINGANAFGTGTITNVATFAPAIAQNTNNSTINLQYDPSTGNLDVITNGIGYGTITLNASPSVFTPGVFGTSPEFYSDDNGDGTDLFFGVLVGQQTANVLLPGVVDPNLSLATLLQDITVASDTNGPPLANITFSTTGAATPEPTAMAIIALTAGSLLRRRRRN